MPYLARTLLGLQQCLVGLHVLFTTSPNPLRVGSFVGLYKLILNSLPILLPEPGFEQTTRADIRSRLRADPDSSDPSSSVTPFYDDDEIQLPMHKQKLLSRRRVRLSSSAQAHQVWVRKKTRRWYAIFAGSLAGALAILFERKDRRVGIAQQMFVRYGSLFRASTSPFMICQVVSKGPITPYPTNMA